MSDLHGVRVEIDGTRRDLTIPADDYQSALRQELGGYVEFAHYGTAESAVCAVVGETSAYKMRPNKPATQFVEALRGGGSLGYWLHGPVVFLGYLPRADLVTDLSGTQRALLEGGDAR